MENEIKINKTNKSLTFINNGIAFSQFGIADETLDYIINLQQENERLKYELNVFKNDKVYERLGKLREENERLKQDYINLRNYIKMRNVSTEVEDKALLYNIELENINKKKYLDYKSRCEKASDNLKRNYWIKEHEHNDDVVNMTLNILQNGSDDK